MIPKYFDIHSHLNSVKFDEDREEVIAKMVENGVSTIVIGTDLETSKQAVSLADKYENIYACIGVHPVDDPTIVFDEEAFEELVRHPKVVAVGECGFDFFRTPRSFGEVGQLEYERQKKLFLDQIEFAVKHNKSIMIHSRDASLELLEILEPLKKVHGDKLRGNIHFFTYSLEIAQRFFAIGFTVSFTGVITFPPAPDLKGGRAGSKDYDEVVKNAPLDMIMAETDSPYVAPEPYRGKRNEPNFVLEVYKKIAEIRGEDEELVRNQLVNNALRMIR